MQLLFALLLIVLGIVGLVFIDGPLRERERLYEEAAGRHPAAARLVEDMAERHGLGLRDVARTLPNLGSSEEMDAVLSRFETMSPTEVEAEFARRGR